MGLDISTQTIGVCILLEDGSDSGKIIELTHISPRVPNNLQKIEELFLKKRIVAEFLAKFKDFGITHVVIEEPLLRSNNVNTVSTLLRFNGMVSDAVYSILNVVPEYISNYDARKYAFPELMKVRKFNKKAEPYDNKKILKSLKKNEFVLFGEYPWTVDKKCVVQDKVATLFPNIEWLYDKKGKMKKENFDSTDAYTALHGSMNKKKYGELELKSSNIKETNDGYEYDVSYWGKTVHSKIYFPTIKKESAEPAETNEDGDTDEG